MKNINILLILFLELLRFLDKLQLFLTKSGKKIPNNILEKPLTYFYLFFFFFFTYSYTI